MTNRNRNFRLVVLDWDGTVMDSSVALNACMRRSLEDLGVEPPSDRDLHALVGLGLAETMVEICPQLDAAARSRIVERYRELWFSTYRFRSKVFEGAEDALTVLAARDYRLAVATGKSRPGLDYDLESTGLGPYFEATRTISEACSKPAPDMLLQLMDEIGAASQETVMVGDSTFDLDMARRARAASVGVLTGAYRRQDLMPYEPLACLTRLGDLPRWLESRRAS